MEPQEDQEEEVNCVSLCIQEGWMKLCFSQKFAKGGDC
jgi:hypothetical protein